MQSLGPKTSPVLTAFVPELNYAEPAIVFTHSNWPCHFHYSGTHFTSSQEETSQIAPNQQEGTGDVRGISLHQEFDETGE
jgi:hypothetical protein